MVQKLAIRLTMETTKIPCVQLALMPAINCHLGMRCAKMQLHAMAIVEFFQTPEIFETMHYEFEFPAFSSTTTDICSRAVTK